jgi:hypothetical protein
MEPIQFFSDEIEIIPHSATEAGHLSRPVSVREFAKNEPCRLYMTDADELYLETYNYPHRFIEGPSA